MQALFTGRSPVAQRRPPFLYSDRHTFASSRHMQPATDEVDATNTAGLLHGRGAAPHHPPTSDRINCFPV